MQGASDMILRRWEDHKKITSKLNTLPYFQNRIYVYVGHDFMGGWSLPETAGEADRLHQENVLNKSKMDTWQISHGWLHNQYKRVVKP